MNVDTTTQVANLMENVHPRVPGTLPSSNPQSLFSYELKIILRLCNTCMHSYDDDT